MTQVQKVEYSYYHARLDETRIATISMPVEEGKEYVSDNDILQQIYRQFRGGMDFVGELNSIKFVKISSTK